VKFDLTGKVAVVTRALGLPGREHLKALGTAGASLVVTDVSQAACEGFAAELAAMTGRAVLAVAADVTRKDDVLALRERILERFGQVDVVVNHAAADGELESADGALKDSRLESFPLEAWQRSLDVDATGVFLACQVLGTEMARREGGSIVNVASTHGLISPGPSLHGAPDGAQRLHESPADSTTRGAVVQLTRHLASHWGRSGVRVNAICPGGVRNGQEPCLGEVRSRPTTRDRIAARTEYAGAVVFLASDASSYVTGARFVIDGGLTAW
jgi:NAD(P)-dependent dehydrogenase (short-subunit alcohol dehydrogenase family)